MGSSVRRSASRDMYEEIFAGLDEDPAQHLTVTFEADHDEMVMVRDIPVHSLCEHHLVPFAGRAHVAYIPGDDGRITGLSKIARLVDGYAKRPQVQERLTTQIADALVEVLKPEGVFVMVEAEHFCMSMRGVKKPGALTITSAVRGLFKTNPATPRRGTQPRHAPGQPALARALRAERLDPRGDVGGGLLEVALELLERSDVVAGAPEPARQRVLQPRPVKFVVSIAPVTVFVVLVVVMVSVVAHSAIPSCGRAWRARKPVIVSPARPKASAQLSSRARPSSVRA